MGILVEQLKNQLPAHGVIRFQDPPPQVKVVPEVISFEGQSEEQVRAYIAEQPPTNVENVLAIIKGV